MYKPNCYVITGTVGAGKTTLLDALIKATQYALIPEIARSLVQEQLACGDDAVLPWTNRPRFEELLLERRIEAFVKAPVDRPCVCDRGIPETVAFFRSDGYDVPPRFAAASREFRYNPTVFCLPPWKEIYENRPERPQTFAQAVRIGELIVEVYRELGYDIVEVPIGSIEDRVACVTTLIEARGG